MKLVEWSFEDPAANLACDEVLLDDCDEGGGEWLRVWEAPSPFVVVGYGNHTAAEVNLDACRGRDVPILRRCSGGGTVLQAPGCLSYAVVLQVRRAEALGTVTGTNRFVMETNRLAISKALGIEVSIQGHTDLAVWRDGTWVKFSGNAQRRRRNAILFHGTILCACDLRLVAELLRFPSKQPDYRAGRQHDAFVMNVRTSRGEIAKALKSAWGAVSSVDERLENELRDRVTTLARDRYATDEWNLAR